MLSVKVFAQGGIVIVPDLFLKRAFMYMISSEENHRRGLPYDKVGVQRTYSKANPRGIKKKICFFLILFVS